MKALVIQGPGKAEVSEIAEPKLRPDYVKVKVVAVALNPTDWKHIDYLPSKGAIVGCDYSGIVEEVGDKVTADVKKGDKIAGIVHGANLSNHEDGGFAEYLMAKDRMFIHVPEYMSMEEAASIGVGVITVGQAMYQSLQLPWPTEPSKEPFPLLIYGGSTATGTLAIQYAKLSGLTVVTTASPRNHELCKSLGADAVFDYNDKECAKKIRDYTNDKLRFAFDTVVNNATTKICADALSTDGTSQELHYTSLLTLKPDEFPRKDVNVRSTLAYTAIGETYMKMGRTNEGKPEHYNFARKFWELSEKLFVEKKIKCHPIDLRSGGLGGILEGLGDLKNNKVSGKKLVYKIE